MRTYQAYFKRNKYETVVKLMFGVVSRTSYANGIVTAYMHDPEDPAKREYKFRVSKPEKPCGSRCVVRAVQGRDIPTVGRDRSCFQVALGTAVLFSRPHTGSAAFPVISWDEYQEAVRGLNGDTGTIGQETGHKHDHRWVDPPPSHAPK